MILFVIRGDDQFVLGEPQQQLLTGGDLRRGADDAAVGVLRDDVAAAERGRGRQRQQPGLHVRDVVARPVQARVQALAGALRERVHLLRLALDLPDRVGDGGPRPDRVQPCLLAVEPAAHAAAAPVPQLGDQGQLLGHVGHDPLGGVGRGGGAQVRDVVEQRGVLLVPDGRHHRRPAGRHRAEQVLVGEREQVFERAAAPGDHDHVDLGVRVQLPQRLDDLARRVRALDGGLLDTEPDGGPAPLRVLHHVPLRRGLPAADQPDDTGQEGQRALPFGGEQAFGRELLAQPLQPGEQLADPHRADLERGERERAPGGVEVRLNEHHHAGALGGAHRVEDLPGADHLRGHRRPAHPATLALPVGSVKYGLTPIESRPA